MKRSRRHTNTKGSRAVKSGKTTDQVRKIAKKLRIPYDERPEKTT